LNFYFIIGENREKSERLKVLKIKEIKKGRGEGVKKPGK
jgi:hypothetical protein